MQFITSFVACPSETTFCLWCCQRVAEIIIDGRETIFDLDEDGSADLTRRHTCFNSQRYRYFLRANSDELEPEELLGAE